MYIYKEAFYNDQAINFKKYNHTLSINEISLFDNMIENNLPAIFDETIKLRIKANSNNMINNTIVLKIKNDQVDKDLSYGFKIKKFFGGRGDSMSRCNKLVMKTDKHIRTYKNYFRKYNSFDIFQPQTLDPTMKRTYNFKVTRKL